MAETEVSSDNAELSGLHFVVGSDGDDAEPGTSAQDDAHDHVDELKLAQSRAGALLQSRLQANTADADRLAKVPAVTQAEREVVEASLATEGSAEEPQAPEVVASVAVTYRGLPPRSKARLVTLLNEWACWHHENAPDIDASNQLLLPIAKQIEVLLSSRCSMDLCQALICSDLVPHGKAAPWPQHGLHCKPWG